jgi:glutathione peroxidase
MRFPSPASTAAQSDWSSTPASRSLSSTPPRNAGTRRSLPGCSNCGRYRERGLLIIGVPSNDFGGQEPGGAAEINKTAHDDYGVSFPLAAKVEVRGPSAHPFFKWAALERPGETPRWNFHKYLIGRDGRVAAAFSTQIEPMDARVIAAIEKELRAP